MHNSFFARPFHYIHPSCNTPIYAIELTKLIYTISPTNTFLCLVPLSSFHSPSTLIVVVVMDLSSGPQLIEHLSQSLPFTPFDTKWMPVRLEEQGREGGGMDQKGKLRRNIVCRRSSGSFGSMIPIRFRKIKTVAIFPFPFRLEFIPIRSLR